MFKTTDDALSRNIDAINAALDQAPHGILRTLLRWAKRFYERRVPAYYPTVKDGAK